MTPGDAVYGLDFGNHLSVILSAPMADNNVAIANFTTHGKPSCGDNCVVVTPAEYAQLDHDSCVFYRAAFMNPVAPLDRDRAAGQLREAPPLPAEILARVQEGALASRFTAEVVKSAIRETTK